MIRYQGVEKATPFFDFAMLKEFVIVTLESDKNIKHMQQEDFANGKDGFLYERWIS